ncbi:MAG: FAD-dependent oxidoreductase, partial [Spirochaetales bacterium]|nr:FAD-dependent oxidoreductase [Spirochaetales bacterium]
MEFRLDRRRPSGSSETIIRHRDAYHVYFCYYLNMREQHHDVEFCVIGGGMAGLIAAISAARKGTKTALVQDRPVLGGNASSEIRMWISGAHGDNNHETGILEEIQLENSYRQTYPSYSVWDSVLWEKARFQENLLLFLNCSVNKVEHENSRITGVTGWQMTTETWHSIRADLFADCTGDGTIGAIAGAEFRIGREKRGDHDESIAPETADKKTMGMSCLIQARETDRFQEYIPPTWAYRYNNDGEFPEREHTLTGTQNFWWLEVGGTDDSIHDSEDLRDELVKIAYGVWDHIKNRGDHGADNWVLDWTGFLPGKRESRRFIGDHILTQNDVEAEGRHFEDIVAFGGWTMDDHFPEGFYKKQGGTIFHPAPSPYGIPYRCLYSKNIKNLFIAGRNISATHAALSSTRV